MSFSPSLLSQVRKTCPLIHCITNPISINQCANAVLCVGARPIMAEHPRETREITLTANALLMNLGNITDARMASMETSARAAGEKGIPFVVDAVGVACSLLRRDYIRKLLGIATPAVIKGNASEILSLHSDTYRSPGVDADDSLSFSRVSSAAAALAKQYQTVILVSGKEDIVTDGKKLYLIKNGTPALSSVTGTGCMLGVLCATFLAAGCAMDAAVCACLALGISGEMADTGKGTGSFMVNLMDALSTLTPETMEKYMKLEDVTLE